jgi:hypothetical protein
MDQEKPDKLNYKISLIAAIFMALFALVISVVIVETLPLTDKKWVLGPGYYPLLLSGGMLLCSLFLIFQLVSGRSADAMILKGVDRVGLRRALSLFGLTVISVGTIPLFGFLGSMFLFSLVHLSYLEPRKEPLMWRLIYSASIPLCVYYLFEVLSISLPVPFWLE